MFERIMEKYSFSAKKHRIIRASREAARLNKVARHKISHMPHQVRRRSPNAA